MADTELRSPCDDDLVDVCALINRAMLHDGLPRVLTLEELREELDLPYVDLTDDARVAVRDGRLVGWTWVWNPPNGNCDERAYVMGDVDPASRGRGVGRELLAWGLARASDRVRSHEHPHARFVRVDAIDSMADRHRLYARFGFEPVRWFEELLRPLADLPAVRSPVGTALVPWPAERDDELRLVHNAAFADHWGTTPTDVDDWRFMVSGHGARLDLSVAALDEATGDVVALCLNHAYPEDDHLTGRHEAWIDSLATAKRWRGRGLASAMIAWSLGAFRSAGFSHAAIGVDTDNPSGAARLYRNLGFERMRRSVTHQLEIELEGAVR